MKATLVDLHEISVSVSPDRGVRIMYRKYKTKRTASNFLPVQTTEADEADGFSFILHQRVPTECLLVVDKIGIGDDHRGINRNVYFLAKDIEKAKVLVRDVVNELLTRMKSNTDKMVAAWKSRK